MNGQYCTKFSTFVSTASCLGFPRIERALLKMNEWLLEITKLIIRSNENLIKVMKI